MKSTFNRPLIGTLLLAGAAFFPTAASATLNCTVNGDNKWTACTCHATQDPNCSADWCDGAFSNNGGSYNTCTFTTPKPRGDGAVKGLQFGTLKGTGASTAPIVQPGTKATAPNPATKASRP